MKTILRSTLMMLLGAMLLAGCAKDNRIIEKPVFLASNTTSIEVSNVTLTDSTTVLDIFARYIPKYWIKIGPNSFLTDDKGNTYPITTGVGIELGKEFWMPESGEAEFQLVFPRLRNGAKFFDFSEEPEIEGGFKIWGVQLKGNELPELALPEEILSRKVDKVAQLEVPELKFGEATIKGKVLDYQSGMPAMVKIIAFNPLVGYDGESEAKIEADGTFSYAMPVLGTMRTVVSYGEMGVNADIFVAPGQVSEVYLNIREGARKRSKFHAENASYGNLYYYQGPMENVVREMPEANLLVMQHLGKSDTYDFGKKPLDLLEEYKQNETAKIVQAREAVLNSSLGNAMKAYLDAHISMQQITSLLEAPSILSGKYAMANRDMEREAFSTYYMSLYKAMPKDYMGKEMFDVLTQSEILIMSELGNLVRQVNRIQEMSGIGEGLFLQLGATAKLYRGIKDFSPLTDAQKEEMKSLPEACQQYLMAENDKLLAKIEANKKKSGFRVNEAGEVANEDLFASIISKFRGKVLLVDFWATWCGPCRMANKEMAPMKEELKDKDIVYVYITGETSPKGTWENMIPDIHGEHFRVTDKQWAYLGNAMGIEGVPTYFVIDREGNIKYKSVGFPGVQKMKEELNKALDK